MGVESHAELVRVLLPWFMPVIVHSPGKARFAPNDPASPASSVGFHRRNPRNDRQGGTRPVRGFGSDPAFLADGPLAAASRPDFERTRSQSGLGFVHSGQSGDPQAAGGTLPGTGPAHGPGSRRG